MESNNVVQDAVELAKAILDSLLPTDRWTIVNVARNGDRIINLTNISEIPPSFGYSFDNVPRLLHQEGVIEAVVRNKWFVKVVKNKLRSSLAVDDSITSEARKKMYIDKNEIAKFYSGSIYTNDLPKIGGQATILINKEKLINFIKRHKDLPTQRDFYYENSELHIRLKDGSTTSLDLSKAKVLRPVFETYFYLFKDTGRNLFERSELLKKYKEITGEGITLSTFSDRKSAICGKMIKPKPALKDRIIWEFDNIEKKYRFEILPLSDK